MALELTNAIKSYITCERNDIVISTHSTSPYLFLGRNGKPTSYSAFYKALKKAGKAVRDKHPELNLGDVHTHAGRSTFAANLRDAQLKARREGKPTISDDDFCKAMDWKSISNLDVYDRATRIHEVAPMIDNVFDALSMSLKKLDEEESS